MIKLLDSLCQLNIPVRPVGGRKSRQVCEEFNLKESRCVPVRENRLPLK